MNHVRPITRFQSRLAAALAAVVAVALAGTTVQAQAADDGGLIVPNTGIIDPSAVVESDDIVTDEPAVGDDVAPPASFGTPSTSTTQSYTWDSSGAQVQYLAAAGDTWWDGICTDGESRYTIIKKYPRPRNHSRMEGDIAKMYCGKKDRLDETPASEAAFGIRHIRPYHKSQFAKLAALKGSTWGHWMHWAISWTLKEPARRTVQDENRFCYEKKFGFKNPNGTTFDRYVIVILGKTGQRIITSFPRKSANYCAGPTF